MTMKTVINIGTNRGNITGVVMDKPFEEITLQDIKEVVKREFPASNPIVHGWTPKTNKDDKISNTCNPVRATD